MPGFYIPTPPPPPIGNISHIINSGCLLQMLNRPGVGHQSSNFRSVLSVFEVLTNHMQTAGIKLESRGYLPLVCTIVGLPGTSAGPGDFFFC